MGPTCLFSFTSWSILIPKQIILSLSISFIIIEYSLNMYILRYFSKISFSSFTLYPCLEIRKIFRLSQNLTKFDRVARFRETNLMAQSVSSSEIHRIFYYSLSHSSTITKRQNYRFTLFHKNVIYIFERLQF